MNGVTSNKDIKRAIRAALRRGWTVENGRGKHGKLVWVDGTRVTYSSSPNCPFAAQHFEQDLRRVESDHAKAETERKSRMDGEATKTVPRR